MRDFKRMKGSIWPTNRFSCRGGVASRARGGTDCLYHDCNGCGGSRGVARTIASRIRFIQTGIAPISTRSEDESSAPSSNHLDGHNGNRVYTDASGRQRMTVGDTETTPPPPPSEKERVVQILVQILQYHEGLAERCTTACAFTVFDASFQSHKRKYSSWFVVKTNRYTTDETSSENQI